MYNTFFFSLINVHPGIFFHKHSHNLTISGLDSTITHYRGTKNETGTFSAPSDWAADKDAAGEG